MLIFIFFNQHLIKLSNGWKVTHGPVPYNSVFLHFIEKIKNGNLFKKIRKGMLAPTRHVCNCFCATVNITNRRMNGSKEN